MENIKLERYPEYKDSGVEWIGNIPEHWKVTRLKHLLKFTTGGTPSSHSEGFYDGNEPWVTISDMSGRYIEETHHVSSRGIRAANITLTPAGSLLYSFKLSVGQVAFAPIDLYTNEAIASFHPLMNINLNFWYYLLPIFVKKNANTNIYGALLLNQDLIKNAILIAPPLSEQTRIAAFLDRKTAQIDQAIAQKERLIELLKERRQILIHNAVTRGLDPNVKMKDSGVEWIGEVPEHWEVTRVKNVFRLIVEPAPKNNDFELLSVYTDIGVKPRKELEERGNKASTTDGYWFVKKGDIVVNKLLAWMGAIGVSDYDGVTSPAYDILRAKSKIDSNYFHYLFRTKTCVSELRKHSRGIMDMRLRLYFDKFGDILIPCPEFKEQQKIVEFIDQKSAQIANAINLKEQEIEKIKEYKATLINSSVTGKILIKN